MDICSLENNEENKKKLIYCPIEWIGNEEVYWLPLNEPTIPFHKRKRGKYDDSALRIMILINATVNREWIPIDLFNKHTSISN